MDEDGSGGSERIDRARRLLVAGGLAMTLPCPAGAAANRIADLVARMTIEEKAGQLSCFSDTVRPLGRAINPGEDARSRDAMLREVRAGRVGMLFNGHGAAGARIAQQAALGSRLGIPLAFAADVIHGYETIFPIPLAEAAAFDPGLSTRVARAVAVEAAAGGLHWTFAPMADVARDQRWGRVAEGAGEDVHLASLLTAARVRGFQGADLARDDALAATPKHFLGYGAVRGGMEYAGVDVSNATLLETFAPPFAAAFAAGAATVMASFTNVGGVPASANRALLTGMLRERMGFGGPCVSDYDAVRELVAHGVAADGRDAARLAILAGIDMDMQSGLFLRHLPDLVATGEVPLSRVDAAVTRVLTLKMRLGLFDRPFRSLGRRAAARAAAAARDRRALACEAATRAIVLLRNDGDLLPLAPRGRRLALIGPFAEDRDNLDGPWRFAGDPRAGIDIASGIRAVLADPAALAVERGCGIDATIPGGVARAVAAARAADLVLLAVGEGADMSGEANSRVDIGIPAPQRALAEAVAATGRPMVVLLRHGRALALDGAIADAPAILATWFLGQQTGTAIADVLFGRAEPTGRLPVSFPIATGQEPWSYDRPSTGRPPPPGPGAQPGTGRWRDAPDAARFPFGHGLGYTRIVLSNATVTVGIAGAIAVSVDAANLGERAGTETIQLYAHPRTATRAQPQRALKGFAKVLLSPGERRRVAIPLDPAALLYVGGDGRWVRPEGPVDLWIAKSSDDPGLALTVDLPRRGDR